MKAKYSLLHESVIVAAAAGDALALSQVLRHYEGFIAHLSTRRSIDENGNPCFRVDEWMRRRLETKLVTRIVTAFHTT